MWGNGGETASFTNQHRGQRFGRKQAVPPAIGLRQQMTTDVRMFFFGFAAMCVIASDMLSRTGGTQKSMDQGKWGRRPLNFETHWVLPPPSRGCLAFST